MYKFNISLYNQIYNSNLDIIKDKNVLSILDYVDFFSSTKQWLKKQGFSIITIFDPNKEEIEIHLIKKSNNNKIIFKSLNIDEKQALFDISNELFEYINTNNNQ